MKKWNAEEIEYLNLNYKKIPTKEICEFLNRKESSIYTMASKLGFSNSWNEEEKHILITNYSDMHNDDLIKLLPNRTRHQICDMAVKLNLKKSNVGNMGRRNNKKERFIEDLIIFEKQLGRTPFLSEILREEWSLSNSSFFRYFGSYVELCKELNFSINQNVFGKVCPIYKAEDGSDCWSKPELIITNYLISNNIQFVKDEEYSKYLKSSVLGTKRFDWLINKDTFVEYFGMMDKEYYRKKAESKIKICQDNRIILIDIYEKDLRNLNNKIPVGKPVETKRCSSDITSTPISPTLEMKI